MPKTLAKAPLPFANKTTVNRNRNTLELQELLKNSPPEICLQTEKDIPALPNHLDIEIGFGDGERLLERAITTPQTLHIGIELYIKGLVQTLQTVESKTITNLKLIPLDARLILSLLSKEQVQCLRIPFPDPWHKKRHHKRRLIQRDLVENILRVLEKNGHFIIETDSQSYAEHIQDLIQTFPTLTATPPFEKDEIITKFEKRAKKENRTIHRFFYQKI